MLSENVHVPMISPAVPLDRLHIILSAGHVMVVDVIVTPVIVLVPNLGPSLVKLELVQVIVRVDVVGLQVYVPLAVYVLH